MTNNLAPTSLPILFIPTHYLQVDIFIKKKIFPLFLYSNKKQHEYIPIFSFLIQKCSALYAVLHSFPLNIS